ncbi:hypothetical protein F2Q70_00012331 [Brassica cretica]|uniref:Uncharacterized protein n=1 Tax=Brassica cretica TaxID=69181 RepID=A0A8S9M2D9_BRACR|nr:hypothetical protein F2Q70_00012331 [Brassica cretica]
MRNKEWFSHGLWEIALKSRQECMDSCRIDVLGKFGRYVATELGWTSAGARSLRSNQARTARSLCSDRARTRLGRYVATEIKPSSVAR